MSFTPPPMHKSVVSLKKVAMAGIHKNFGKRLLATWKMVFWVLVEFQHGWYGFQAVGLQRG